MRRGLASRIAITAAAALAVVALWWRAPWIAGWLEPPSLANAGTEPQTPPATGPALVRIQRGPQAGAIAVVHRAGQTFVTWREIDPAPKPELTIAELATLKRDAIDTRHVSYRVYRSAQPIARIQDAEFVSEAAALSGLDGDFYGVSPQPTAPVRRYVIEDGKPAIEPGRGLAVVTAPRAGQAYFAVTTVVGTTENVSLGPENATVAPVTESTGAGIPVLQRIEKPAQFQYIDNATLRFYVRWESPPNSNIAGRPIDYLVAIPPDVREPAPVGMHMHCWGGSLQDCYGWWFNAQKGAVLVSANEIPYDWWTGYHEALGRTSSASAEEWKRGVVRPYSQTRMLSFVDWLATTMKLDLTRMFVAGNSMGGSGAIMMALRHAPRFAWTVGWVGVHVPADSPQYRSSYEAVFGKLEWALKFEDGTPVWDYFNDVWYLRHHPGQDVGFITFSNGKNDSAIGWPQAVEFFRALQETRQPHLFVWGQDGHGQRARMPAGGGERVNPLDLRTNQSVPAFTHGSLDDDPGNGAADSGAPAGQANAFMTWRPDSIVDEPARWAITMGLAEDAPRPATVDVTPRRLQQFKLKPGDKVEWVNTPTGGTPQRGEVVADQWGLVTVPQVQVPKAGARLQLSLVR